MLSSSADGFKNEMRNGGGVGPPTRPDSRRHPLCRADQEQNVDSRDRQACLSYSLYWLCAVCLWDVYLTSLDCNLLLYLVTVLGQPISLGSVSLICKMGQCCLLITEFR